MSMSLLEADRAMGDAIEAVATTCGCAGCVGFRRAMSLVIENSDLGAGIEAMGQIPDWMNLTASCACGFCMAVAAYMRVLSKERHHVDGQEELRKGQALLEKHKESLASFSRDLERAKN